MENRRRSSRGGSASRRPRRGWGNLSDPAREQFFWAAPGPFSGEPEVPSGGRGEDGKPLEAPEDFLLLLLHPRSVHYLRLSDNFAQRDRREPDGEWTATRVNP